MDMAQNSYSSLRELMEFRGHTAHSLAQKLHVPVRTIYGWLGGKNRPSLERLRLLAEHVDISLEVATTMIWRETPGDPCDRHHQCKAIKVLPANEKAIKLDFQVSCERCGTPRLHRGGYRFNNHDQTLCLQCSGYADSGFVAVTCPGYQKFGDTFFSTKHVQERRIRPRDLRRYMRREKIKSWLRAQKNFRCGACRSALSSHTRLLRAIREHLN